MGHVLFMAVNAWIKSVDIPRLVGHNVKKPKSRQGIK